jgi:hypothetical protein
MNYSILHIAPENFAGVPYDFMHMHATFGNRSRLITMHANPLGFAEDICLDFPIARSSFAKSYRLSQSLIRKGNTTQQAFYWKPSSIIDSLFFYLQTISRVSRVEALIKEEQLDAFDIMQYDGGLDFTRDSRFAKRWKAMGKSIITCYYGSDLRARGIIREMDEMSDLNLTSEYDHLAMKDDLEYVFYPYDTSELPWVDPEKDFTKVRIVHSPTNRLYKGTELILSVIEKLKKSFSFEFHLLEQLPRHEVLRIKSECTISIDQVGGQFGGTGYGKAGIESLAMGIPTITNMTDEYASWLPGNPFTIANDARQLEDALVEMIESPELCKSRGEIGKAWVESQHSYDQVHAHLISLFKKHGILR